MLGPGAWRGFGEDEIGKLWKAFAYSGGDAILDVVMDVTTAEGRPCRPDLLGASPPQGPEGRLRESARMAVAAMMLPADTSKKQLTEVDARTRRHEQRREYKQVPARVAEAAARLLESAEKPQPRARPDCTPTRAVAQRAFAGLPPLPQSPNGGSRGLSYNGGDDELGQKSPRSQGRLLLPERAERDAPCQHSARRKQDYVDSPNPLLRSDTKKKARLGNF